MTRISKLRTDLGWSQQQMGEFLGLSQTAVSRLETGQAETGPVARLLEQLEALLAGGREFKGAAPAALAAVLMPAATEERIAS